jgi:hypothetical protein
MPTLRYKDASAVDRNKTRTCQLPIALTLSAQFLVHDDMLSLIAVEHMQPALAAIDADPLAALAFGIGFDLPDQRKPPLHIRAAAHRDDADLADLGIDQDSRSRGLDRPSVPGHPQQTAAGKNVGLDILKRVQFGPVASRFQQRADMRPELVNPPGVDANKFSRGGHSGA